MMRVRLGVFDHDPLIFWRAPPKVRARGEHFVHHATGIFGCRKIQIEITFDGFDAADAIHASDLDFDLLGDFLSALRHLNLFSAARFVGRGRKEGCGDAPFTAERNRRPLEFCERNSILRAELADLCFDDLLFSIKHDGRIISAPPHFLWKTGRAPKAGGAVIKTGALRSRFYDSRNYFFAVFFAAGFFSAGFFSAVFFAVGFFTASAFGFASLKGFSSFTTFEGFFSTSFSTTGAATGSTFAGLGPAPRAASCFIRRPLRGAALRG